VPTDRFSGLVLGTNLSGTDNADGTITIDASGGGSGSGTPSFRAYRATTNQSVAGGGAIAQFQGETFDPDGTYDTSTYTWTPAVTGLYLLVAAVHFIGVPDTKRAGLYIYKGASPAGANIIADGFYGSPATLNVSAVTAGLAELTNTDGIRLWAYHDNGSALDLAHTNSWMAGYFIRP
jgi:hypothetical protein